MNPARHEATNPNTSPARLEQLARVTELAPLVAANPNTPSDTLARLAKHYPDQVLDNPTFHLDLALNANTLTDLPNDTLQQLALRDAAPEPLITTYQQRALLREQTPLTRRATHNAQAQLAKYQEHHAPHQHTPDPDLATLKAHASLNPPTPNPRAPLEVIAELAGPDAAWLASPALAPTGLLELLTERHWNSGKPLTAITSNPATPRPLLKRLLAHPDGSTRRAAALHPNLTATDLANAARSAIADADLDHAASLLTNLARRPDTSGRDLRWLINWTTKNKRGQIGALLYAAANPNTPHKSLRALHQLATETGNHALLEGLAANPHLPHDLARELLNCDKETRRALAQAAHRHPRDVQERLLSDPDPLVRDAAIASTDQQDLISEILSHLVPGSIAVAREQAAKNPHLTADQVEELKRERDRRVRNAIAHHPLNPPRGPWGTEVEQAVLAASSPHLSPDQGQAYLETVRNTLHGDPQHPASQRAAHALAMNPALPESIRLQAATILTVQLTQHPAQKLHDHATEANEMTYAIAQAHANAGSQAAHAHALTPQALEGWVGLSLAFHWDWRVRLVLAARRDLPVALRGVLERDGDSRVLAALEREVASG